MVFSDAQWISMGKKDRHPIVWLVEFKGEPETKKSGKRGTTGQLGFAFRRTANIGKEQHRTGGGKSWRPKPTQKQDIPVTYR